VLEPEWPTVFAVQPWLAVGKAAGFAAGTAGAVGAVEEGNVLVADVAEPGHILSVVTPIVQSRSLE
jgi:hypothetical protein